MGWPSTGPVIWSGHSPARSSRYISIAMSGRSRVSTPAAAVGYSIVATRRMRKIEGRPSRAGGAVIETNKRPISILILSCLYIVTGALMFAYHFHDLTALDTLLVELVELLAVVAGAFMLRGRNWARWLALAWIAFHVAISFPVVRMVLIHSLFLAAIAWILFTPAARRYFAWKSLAWKSLE